jgi:hypothetical protein
VNGVELHLLSRKLMMIAAEAMPAGSALRRIAPGDRLVLEDVISHMGTSADGRARSRDGCSTWAAGQVSTP